MSKAFDELGLSVRLPVLPGADSVSPMETETVITINGRNLIETILEVELPHAAAEGHPNIAGAYAGIPPDLAFLPSEHLLGRPDADYSDHYMGSGETTKTAVLMCECGEPYCWPLCVRIEVMDDVVVWADFEQPHRASADGDRPWTYETVGPFTFERAAYEAALTRSARDDG